MLTLNVSFSWLGIIIFFLLLAVNSIWSFYCLKAEKSKLIVIPPILFMIAGIVIVNTFLISEWDEAEHLHCAWLVSKGLIPYKDFWQHHLPMLWVCLAPLIKNLKPSIAVFSISRLFCALIFTIISLAGWKIAQRIWKGKARLSIYLLLLFSGCITWEFSFLRPELIMILLLLLGIYFLSKAIEEKNIFFLLTGIMFSSAMSFSTKQWLFIILPVIIILLIQKKSKVLKLILYVIGLFIGCLPLLIYLFKNNIIKEFIYWVFSFNSKYIVVSADFMAVVGVIAISSWILLIKEFRKNKDQASLVLLISFVLCCLNSLLRIYSTAAVRYLNFWLILCAILGSGYNTITLLDRFTNRITKSLILGSILTLLIIPGLSQLKWYRFSSWERNKMVISRLIGLCENESCIAFTPYHPIFAYDTIGLYSAWQYKYIEEFSDPQVKKYVASKDVVKQIINHPPAVISYSVLDFISKEIFDSMKENGLISGSGLLKVADFIKNNYSLKEICGAKFYVRNDNSDKHAWLAVCPEEKLAEFIRTFELSERDIESNRQRFLPKQ